MTILNLSLRAVQKARRGNLLAMTSFRDSHFSGLAETLGARQC